MHAVMIAETAAIPQASRAGASGEGRLTLFPISDYSPSVRSFEGRFMRRLEVGADAVPAGRGRTYPLTPGRRRIPPAGIRTGREELADRWGFGSPESAARRRKENRRK